MNSPKTKEEMETANTIERLRKDAKAALDDAEKLASQGRDTEARMLVRWAHNWARWADGIVAQTIMPERRAQAATAGRGVR